MLRHCLVAHEECVYNAVQGLRLNMKKIIICILPCKHVVIIVVWMVKNSYCIICNVVYQKTSITKVNQCDSNIWCIQSRTANISHVPLRLPTLDGSHHGLNIVGPPNICT